MFDPTKPVQTRAGDSARIICTDRVGTRPIVALVKQDNTESVSTYTKDGFAYCGESNPNDLVNIPEKRLVWLNVYPNDIGAHLSRAKADANAGSERTAYICVELPDNYKGRFDD